MNWDALGAAAELVGALGGHWTRGQSSHQRTLGRDHMTSVELRSEVPSDHDAIYTVTERAFADRPYADGDEQDVVNRLRDADALSLSLVAIRDGQLLGQITFSPAEVEDGSGPWFALGPVSVAPEVQGEGIGGQLINAGIEAIVSRGALGCILTGDPAYYSRFGFELAPKYAAESEPAEYFQIKWLSETRPAGRFAFHPAFYGEV